MNATDSYKAGKLQEAITAQLQEVKAHPADQAKRLFLFELLAFAGDLDRAAKQIEVIKYDQMELATATLLYRKLLDSEQARRQLFHDGVVPRFFSDQPEHVHLRLNAVQLLREQRPAEAAQVLAEANRLAPHVKGTLNDKPFETLRDCDDVFGTVLEVMAQGGYFWVPLEQVESLTVTAPKYPRDLLWRSARLEMRESSGNVYLPVLYPGSHEHPDDAIKLGRMTDWKVTDDGPVQGVGAHMLLAGEDDVSVLELRQLELSD